MASSTSSASSGGISFTGLLTIVFIILKFTGHFPHSWWWVFSPFWIGFLAILLIGGLFLLIAFILMRWENLKKKRRKGSAK